MFFNKIYLFAFKDRKRKRETEREEEGESQASLGTEPDVGLKLTNREIMT